MPDTKITALTAIGANPIIPSTFPIPMVDLTDTSMAASGTTKKVTVNQILGAGGTATLASATITGDLTVRTNKLAVTSTGVGVGTATPGTACDVASGTVRVKNAAGDSSGLLIYQDTGDASKIFNYYNGSMQFGINNTTAMTLNSTGLGVGTSPTGYGILALKKDNTSAPPYIVLDNRGTGGTDTNTYTQGGILFGAFRDVSNPAYIASITVERKSAAGGASSTGDLIFGTASTPTNGVATERLRIDSSGNVGIGVTPSAWSSGGFVQLQNSRAFAFAGAFGDYISNGYYDGSWKYTTTAAVSRYRQDAGSHQWLTAPSGTAGTAITFTQAMTLDASGNLLVGTTSNAPGGTQSQFVNQWSGAIKWGSTFNQTVSSATPYTHIAFCTNGTVRGSIDANNTTITYSTVSDYRLKDNVQPLSGGLARINALKPSTYKWKESQSDSEGFIAHELASVVPLAVIGEKDAVNEDGSIKPQQVDLSKVVPVLVAAIQELAAEVNALKNA